MRVKTTNNESEIAKTQIEPCTCVCSRAELACFPLFSFTFHIHGHETGMETAETGWLHETNVNACLCVCALLTSLSYSLSMQIHCHSVHGLPMVTLNHGG